ncbi:hypothetical protein EBU91_01485 [bacterium]|jgi:hypothetical protein|nr:hypothetical protein [bacterium]
MKTPITFEQFSKDPVKGLLFIVIVAIGYLYIDIKMNYSGQVSKCDSEVVVLNAKIDKLTEHVRRSDSTLGYTISKVEMLEILRNEGK